MTFFDAVHDAWLGIKREGWDGYVWFDGTGRFWFIHEDGTRETWTLYMQDIDGDDWSVVGGDE